jgi:hypothetical protein
MGRRSRKRGGPAPGSSTRAERDVARAQAPAARTSPRRRPSAAERPAAPWGSFPLSELIILAGLGVLVWGLLSGGDDAGKRVAGGLLLASLGGGELALREHLGGFRSHSALLAGVATFVVVTVIVVALGPVKMWVALLAGVAVFGASFAWMREVFRRRSGGLSFR